MIQSVKDEREMNMEYNIAPADKFYLEKALERLEILAKPPGSLGELETIAARLCSIQKTMEPDIEKRCVIVLAADNGVVEEGVASAPQHVTALQTVNIIRGVTGVGTIARAYHTDLLVADLGVNADLHHPQLINRKIRKSTGNICKEPAMERAEAEKAIETGIELSALAQERGYRAIGVGEMGIGNTSTSTAVLAALLGRSEVSDFIGRGAGLTDEAYFHKKEVVETALRIHKPLRDDPVDILTKVGGLDIAAMTGVYLGAAARGIPVVIDGLISVVGALCAARINPVVTEYLFASHRSFEKGYNLAISELRLSPCLGLQMRLGEGSGCPIMFSVMDGAAFMFRNMATFGEAEMGEDYLQVLGDVHF